MVVWYKFTNELSGFWIHYFTAAHLLKLLTCVHDWNEGIGRVGYRLLYVMQETEMVVEMST